MLRCLAVLGAITVPFAATALARPVHGDPVCPPEAARHPAPAPDLGILAPPLGALQYNVFRKMPGDSTFRPFGHLIVRRSQVPGRPHLLRNISRYDWINGTVTSDTTFSLSPTMAPVCERTHTPSRIVAYTFDGMRSVGRIGPQDSLMAIDDTLPRPAFNSTDLDMLVTALPLKAGFEARLPLYDPEYPGFRMAAVRVVGSTDAGVIPAWVLSVDQPGRPTMFYQIDQKTHQMVQKDFGPSEGPAFRIRLAEGGNSSGGTAPSQRRRADSNR